MKKLMALCLLMGCLCMTACTGEPARQGEGLQVIASNFPLYDFARQIGGDSVQVELLLDPGVESHSFEPTPQDMIAIQKADVFLYIGGESEAWINSLADSSLEQNGVALLNSVELLEEEEQEGHQDHEGHEEHEADEHIWTSPKNAVKMAETICQAFCRADPDNSQAYQSRLAAYRKKLTELDQTFQTIVDIGVRRELIFGDRFPFRYFAQEYGLECYGAFGGCAAQAEPSAATMAFLIDKVKEDGIPVVFYLELSNHSIANAIGEATGAKTALFHSCHNVSKQEFDRGETYLSIMEQNAQRLKEALGE
ncbi:MAG: metal ABC transporter substrate-binding protein [Clostridia bacterium]|nr:metal ABC transporter substrate-binding protein [Clostridia bacterium]